MRFLLDTNIISEVIKPLPSPGVTSWLSGQQDNELCISALTLAEIRRGILEAPPGRKRIALERWFASLDGPAALFAGRILPFNETAALWWAEAMAEGVRLGKPRSALDMIIAATALAHGCSIVTMNERDFRGLDFINPAKGSAGSRA